MLHDLGPSGDFVEGRARVVDVGGRQIGVIVWDGRPYALRNVCPHMGAPLCEGVAAPRLTSDDPLGHMDADRDRPVVVCPWHGWAFDLESGDAVFSGQMHGRSRARVKTYPAEIRDGRIVVEMAQDRAVGAALTGPR